MPMQYLQSRTQWPAVNDFLALRAAPSSNFRIQDDLPSEAAPASRELPDSEAQGQVTGIMKAPMDSSKAQAAAPRRPRNRRSRTRGLRTI